MNNKRTRGIVAVFTAIALVFALVAVGIRPGNVLASQPAAQPNTDVVLARGPITMHTANGITATTAGGTELYTQLWGTIQCFSTWIAGPTVAGAPPTITVKLQASADATYWADITSFPAQYSAGTAYTTTDTAGTYMRSYATLANSNPVTFTTKCNLVNSQ